MIAALTPERDFRGPGCTQDCVVVNAIITGRFGRSDILLHSAAAHEEYGRATTGIDDGGTVVWTGPLVIDRWSKAITLDARRLQLSGREWALLDHLASRIGRACSPLELSVAVWSAPDAHIVRINIARLRQKLAPYDYLIETQIGVGYRLAQLPPVENAIVPLPPRPQKPWSTRYDRCVCCGSSKRPYAAHGRCSYCRARSDKWPHYGPCQAPPPGVAS